MNAGLAEHVTNHPRVSILIPAYNAEKWIRQCVESALSQTYPNKEIIVGDDGSTDRTLQELERLSENITILRSDHRGANSVRNRLATSASGEWLQYLDADDYLLPNKITGQLEALRREQWRPDVIYSPIIVRDEEKSAEFVTKIDPREDPETHFIRWVPFCTHGILLRRSAVLEIGGWKENQRVCQEHELILRLFTSAKMFAYCNDIGAVYRHHGKDTVSKRSPLYTIQMRMEITNRFETWLRTRDSLSRVRSKALYATRIETARNAWNIDSAYASELARLAAESGWHWVSGNRAVPATFQIAQLFLGFRRAQKLAAVVRSARVSLGLRGNSATA